MGELNNQWSVNQSVVRRGAGDRKSRKPVNKKTTGCQIPSKRRPGFYPAPKMQSKKQLNYAYYILQVLSVYSSCRHINCDNLAQEAHCRSISFANDAQDDEATTT